MGGSVGWFVCVVRWVVRWMRWVRWVEWIARWVEWIARWWVSVWVGGLLVGGHVGGLMHIYICIVIQIYI